jgi:integrase
MVLNRGDHIVESLHTSDLAIANERKHARITHWRAEFAKASRGKAHADTVPTYVKLAEEFRQALMAADYRPGLPFKQALRKAGGFTDAPPGETEADAISSQVTDIADRITEHGDEAKAVAFARHAFRGDRPTLREAFDKFLETGDHTERTRAKYRAAFEEFARWHGNALADPADITRDVAERYVDWLNNDAVSGHRKPLAYRSMAERVRQLAHLWKQMEDRQIVPTGSNPFLRHKLARKRRAERDGIAGQPRPYTEQEIAKLLQGPERRGTYNKARILDWYALAFYTGLREDELGSRILRDIEPIRGGYIVHIRKSKTLAGVRSIFVLHDIPVAILRRNIGKRKDPDALLFPYLARPPEGQPLSFYMGKAMGQYRRTLGFGRETDFHSTRRNFYTRCLELNINRDWYSMYVGHSLGGMARHYAGKSATILRAVAQGIGYPKRIEDTWRAALDL